MNAGVAKIVADAITAYLNSNDLQCLTGVTGRGIAFSFGGNNQRLNFRLLRLNTSCPTKIEGG